MNNSGIIYLAKDSDELVSFCKCPDAPTGDPGQLACPWCGCGWLFSCIHCRKAFTFARGVLLDDSWQNLARLDLVNFGVKDPPQPFIDQRAEDMQKLLADVKVGQKYVYLDGAIIPADATDVHFAGRYARHAFDFVPQVEALKNPSIMTDVLENMKYWQTNAVIRKEKEVRPMHKRGA